MAKKIGKFFWFAGGFMALIFFIRFAWIRENFGERFPTYLTPALLIAGALVLVGFYLVGAYLFKEERQDG